MQVIAARKHLPEMFQAPGRDRLGAFLELKDFDGYVARVAHFLERGGDGLKINPPEAGALQIAVVGVKMGEVRPGLADDFGNRLLFRAHCFAGPRR